MKEENMTNGLQFYTLDVESSGLVSAYHEMTEVSIIRNSDRVQLTEIIKCEYPERANADSLMITNKTLADLSKGLSKEEVVEKIDKFLNEDGLTPAHRCIIAHNWTFDKKFIHALYAKVNKEFPANLWMCSMAMTRDYAKKIGMVKPKVNLQASLDIVGVKKFKGAHASQVDTRNTYLLWKDLVDNKKVDYLPFIKTATHILNPNDEEQGLDPDLLD